MNLIDSTFQNLTIGDYFVFSHDIDLFQNGGDKFLAKCIKSGGAEYSVTGSCLSDRRKHPNFTCPKGRGRVMDNGIKVSKLLFDTV